MLVYINDQEQEITSSKLLLDLLSDLDLDQRKGFAVAVNQEVIPQIYWGDKELSHKDKILVINATQGG